MRSITVHYSMSLLRRLRGRLGLQRQRVHAVFDLLVQERVHHPMPRDGELPAERLGHDLDLEVRLRVRIPGRVPGVPGVLEALVLGVAWEGRGRRASAGDRRPDLAGRADTNEGGGRRRRTLMTSVTGCSASVSLECILPYIGLIAVDIARRSMSRAGRSEGAPVVVTSYKEYLVSSRRRRSRHSRWRARSR